MQDSAAEVCFALVFSCSEEVPPAHASACASPTPPPAQVMMERLLSRAQSSGRVDDNVESIRKRFRCGARRAAAAAHASRRVFATESVPVLKLFEDAGKLKTARAKLPPLQAVALTRPQADCTQTPDEVFASISAHFDALR
jgi:hypothetical protein